MHLPDGEGNIECLPLICVAYLRISRHTITCILKGVCF